MPTGANSFIRDTQGNVGRGTPQGNIRVTDAYPIFKNGYPMSISAASGGTQLPSLEVTRVELVNLSGNGVMFVGGIDDDAPYSGRGFWLWPQNFPPYGYTVAVDDLSKVQVCSTVSGQLLQYNAYVIGQNAALDPATQGTQPDNLPPYITSFTPTSGQSGVSPSTQIVVNFNEPIASASVVEANLFVRLSGSANNLSGDALLVAGSGSMQAKFIANSGQITSGKYYNVTASSGIKDVAGNRLSGANFSWYYHTVTTVPPPPDTNGPDITSSVPASGAVSISTTADLTVTFDEQVQSGTVNSTTFKLQNISGNTISATSVTLDASKTTVTFNPNVALGYLQTYRLFVSGVKDLTGNFMSGSQGTIAFNTTVPTFTTIYTNTNGGSTKSICQEDATRAGLKSDHSSSPLRGFHIRRIECYLRKNGSPTGAIVVRHRGGGVDEVKGTYLRIPYSGTFDASLLTTSYAKYTLYDLSGTATVGTDDRFLVEHTTSVAVDDCVQEERDPTETSDVDLFTEYGTEDGYNDDTGRNFKGTLSS